MMLEKIGFGGSCHWCTEAIFLSIKGVLNVDQGWISPKGNDAAFSEAVIVEFDRKVIGIHDLIGIHLHSHSCTSSHSMRSKYRSAVYLLNDQQELPVVNAIQDYQRDFDAPIITEVVPFGAFKLNSANYLNYYFKNPQKPFCENIVNPKLRELIARYSYLVDQEKVVHLL
ncbi:peptide-methionine (S)-S-oxide reductase [Mucilaginibacter sabulilitoris]|uniref:peptide-methionine (S)-S-oxide reductase n=1 Tax=Mucilaginibacter sabulilitoris TaxID=1173583 RepID=A0ABZ0TVZ9_9SPHI|nr:peptide-methionine (S)-S-oxide reductase [Mucilaginibacter sabulilitoris]WPU96951.1 peptide-methionine (S)-S-oxide reductase [Mucilaginibacter sabulilitoris]